MSQNLISLNFTAEDIAAINAAITTLETKFAPLIELSVDERHGLNKMGDKSEAACRQTLILNSSFYPIAEANSGGVKAGSMSFCVEWAVVLRV